ncbi:FAS1 domain-containing protein [Aspergillus foveolatus]|uniref:FAS1 domain-containing protein n=1 Tax=Aspergillus foveolatus TaxID=210207 RepID=UPI003CCDF14D
MKLQLHLTLAGFFCSVLAIQDVLSEVKDSKNGLPNAGAKNPLDSALESSPTFSPAEIFDTTEITKYLNSINVDTIPDTDSWISSFLANHLFNENTNAPSDLVNEVDASTDTHPIQSDKTIYQLISESKYTTILAKIIDQDPKLVEFLNSTHHKITVFAPTDDAFRKILHHHHRHHDGHDGNGHERDGDGDKDHHIPKEVIRYFARYHSSPEVLTAAKLFHAHTVNSALNDSLLGTDKHDNGLPQRLAVRAGFKGLTINFYSHVVAADIGASNGLIHGLDSILLPPPPALLLLDILPTKFSIFNLGLIKTGLTQYLNTTKEESAHGFTIFTPSNRAFDHLGLRINAFLFSPYGIPYLRALLKYHIVPNQTLYSDVLYTSDGQIKPFGVKGSTHLDLETLLDDHEISVDVARFGPYTGFRVNGWQRVAFADVLGKDGVIHVLDRVLIPPKRVEGKVVSGNEGELELEEFMERLKPWVEEDVGNEKSDDYTTDL